MNPSDTSGAAAASPIVAPDNDKTPRRAAVALRYDPSEPAPKVLAKGYGDVAETIIRTAQTHGLFVHDSPELVAVLMHIDIDRHIPPALYTAVAELLGWLYQLDASHRDDPLLKVD
ncbi:MAG: EscU/YscU/HrcU family type III secretion system export apparatus switch protein [Burkholderiaceae bacterium]|nr:EscU/YscU/HrcU family type III secretion system export apparatus switch protein [Burkholderiaceae bacterium]